MDAHCEWCEDAVASGLSSALVLALVALGLGLLTCTLVCLFCHGTKAKALRGRARLAEQKYSLLNKLKIVVGAHPPSPN